MIPFFRALWPILTQPTRRRLLAAMTAMVLVAFMEGLGLLTLAPLLQMLTADDFQASSGLIRVMENVFSQPSGPELARILGVVAFSTYAVKGMAAIAVLRWSTRFAMEEEARLIGRLSRIYLSVPIEVHYRTNTSEFQRTLNTSVRQLFGQAFVGGFSALADMLSVSIIALILVVTDPAIAAIGAVYLIVVLGTYQRMVHRSLRRASDQVHSEQAQVFKEVQQALGAAKEIKVRGTEEVFSSHVEATRRSLLDAYRTVALQAVQPRYVLELVMVGAAGVVGLYAFGTRPAPQATAAIGLFLAAGFRMLAPLNKVFSGFNQARTSLPGARQVARDLELLEPQALSELAAGADAELPREIRLEVRGLGFAYGDGPPVLQSVDLTVEPGEAVALVGGSGAGKSTLVDVLLGLLRPTSGELLIDGRPIGDVRRAWQQRVAYVPQTIALMDDTVRANIELGAPADEVALWNAIRAAQLEEVINELPDGLDTAIGERGVRLSGGQRQRLGVARALYRSPSVLVLDEATSALDNETEARLTSILDGLRGTITTITVAHRLSTVRNADRTYLMAEGRVVDQGTFEELAARNEAFARLLELATLGGAP